MLRQDTVCELIPALSPVYIECGGQVTDRAQVIIKNVVCTVEGVRKIGEAVALLVRVPSLVQLGDSLIIQVDAEFRKNTMKNHTATHLLQAAMIQILGSTIKQAGSLVTADYLRFDFTHYELPSSDQIEANRASG